jgi:four helix bundle protein
MPVNSYRDLKVWQAAMDLASAVYALSRRFPKEERFALTSQLQRSVVSVASNIAEGHARGSTRDYLRFVGIARGSLGETETQLMLAERFCYATTRETGPLLAKADEIGRMLRALQQALRRRASA